MPFALYNSKKKQYCQVVGDGSENLCKNLSQATLYETRAEAEEGFQEHDKWVGPLKIVEVTLKVKS